MKLSEFRTRTLSHSNTQFVSIEVRKCLVILFLIIYGFFSHGPSILNLQSIRSLDSIQRLLYECLLVTCLATIYQSKILREKKIVLYVRDITVTLFILIIIVLTNKQLLQLSLTGDELAYAQGLSDVTTRLITKLPEGLSDVSFKHLINFMQLSILLVIFILNRYVVKNIKKARLTSLILVFLAIRFVTVIFVNSQYQYLQGNSIANNIFSFFWLSTSTVRMGSAAFFVFVAWKLFDLFGDKKLAQTVLKMLFTFSILQIPVFLDSLFVLDTTGYFIFIGGFILQKIANRHSTNSSNLLLLICIGVSLRASILIFIPIVAALLIRKKLTYQKSDFMSILLILPFIENLLFKQALGIFNPSDQNSDLILKFKAFVFSLKTLVAFNSILVLVITFMMIVFHRKYTIILLMYICSICFFYIPMIPIGSSGFPKYPLEVFGPIILLGFSELLRYVLQRNIVNISLSFLVGTSLLLSFNNISHKFKPVSIVKANAYTGFENLPNTIINYPINLASSFEYIRRNVLTDKCYNPGVTYGTFNELLEGYSHEEYKEAKNLYTKNVLRSNEITNVIARNSCLVLTTNLDISKFGKVLNYEKWNLVFEDSTPNFKTKVQIWKKSVDTP
jgi:hypothetical protein